MIYKDKEKTKDGRSYYFKVHYKDLYGERKTYKSKKFLTKSEATEAETIFRVNISEMLISSKNITFNDVYNEYIDYQKTRVKPQTLSRYKCFWYHISSIGNIKVNDFNINQYKKLLNYIINQKLTTGYKNKILSFLTRLINYSFKYHNTSTDMLRFIERLKNMEQKKEMQFFTFIEFKQFESVIDDFYWKTFFQMLYYMGLRVGELQGLMFKDLIDNEIMINKTLTTKIKGTEYVISTPKTKTSTRRLPLPKQLVESLNSIKLEAIKHKDYKDSWFIFGFSHPFKNTNITNRKNFYCKQSGVKQIRIHDFRHSCASYLLSPEHGNASIMLVSKWLGHSNITTTLNTYAHLYKNELLDVRNAIEKEI